jgi:hypothetical protein
LWVAGFLQSGEAATEERTMCQCLHVVTYIHIRDMTLTHIRLLRKTTHIAMCSHLCAHLSCKRSDFISWCCSQKVLEALQHENL